MSINLFKIFQLAVFIGVFFSSIANANINDDKSTVREFNYRLDALLTSLPQENLSYEDIISVRQQFERFNASYLTLKQVLTRLGGTPVAGQRLEAEIFPLISSVNSFLDAYDSASGDSSVINSTWQGAIQTYHFYSIEQSLEDIRELQKTPENEILRAQLPVTPAAGNSTELDAGDIIPSYLSQSTQDITRYSADPDAIIEEKANELDNDPVKIYAFVASIKPEFYQGQRKSPVAVLRSGAGNDIDQTLLLAQLYIAAGYEANPVTGVAEVSASYIKDLSGVSGKTRIMKLLSDSGQKFEYTGSKGNEEYFLWQRSWISAQLPYDSYRGATVDKQALSWVAVDPLLPAQSVNRSSTVLLAPDTAADAIINQYLELPPAETTTSLAEYLANNGTDEADESEPEGNGITYLPASLSFNVERVIAEGYLPESADNIVTIEAEAEGALYNLTILETDFTIPQLYNRNVSLTFEAATKADQNLINQSGGINSTLLSEVNLKLVIRIDGEIAAISSDSVRAGNRISLTFTLNNSSETSFTKTLLAGSFYSLAVGGGAITDSPEEMTKWATEGVGSNLLSKAAYQYQNAVYEDNLLLENLTGHKVIYPLPVFTFVSNKQNVDYVLGTPTLLSWAGVNMDALLQPVSSIAADNSGISTPDFIRLSALTSSWHEQDVFEDIFGFESISADELIQTARSQGIEILQNPDRSTIENTSHSSSVINELISQFDSGLNIYVPASPVTVNEWTGSGWIATDPDTGASGYYLSGSIAGGTNTSSTGNTASWSLLDPTSGPIAEGADKVAYVEAYYNGQDIGVAGQTTDITIKTYNSSWQPVANAEVTLYITTGNATFDNGSTIYTLQTDKTGTSAAVVTFDTSTAINPTYMLVSDNDTYTQRVSEVSINTAVGSESSAEQRSSVLSPISVYYGPDEAVLGRITQDSDSDIRASAYDQFENPVANVPVSVVPDGYDVVPEPLSGSASTFSGFSDILDSFYGERGEGSADILREYTTAEHSQVGFLYPGNYCDTFYAFNVSVGGLASERVYRSGQCQPNIEDYQAIVNEEFVKFEEQPPETVHCINSPTVSYYGMSGNESEFFVLTKPQQTRSEAINIKPRLCERRDLVGTNKDDVEFYISASFTPIPGPSGVNISSATGSVNSKLASNGAYTDYLLDVTGTGVGRHKIAYDDSLKSVGEIARYYTVSPSIKQDNIPGTQKSAGQLITTDPISVSYSLNQSGLTLGRLPYLLIYKDGNLAAYYNSPGYSQSGSFTIPAGFPLEFGSEYSIEFAAYYGTLNEVRSNRIPLSPQLIADHTEKTTLVHTVRTATNWECPAAYDDVSITLSRDAMVTVERSEIKSTATGTTESTPSRVFSGNLSKGENTLDVGIDEYPEGTYHLYITATDQYATEKRTSTVKVVVDSLESMPVSHAIYQNVDLHDGSLNLNKSDLSVPLENLALEIARQYNSNRRSEDSYLGIGWTDPNLHLLTETACGTVTVDGVSFEPKNGGYEPVAGYHASLIQSGEDYDFYTRGGVQYHFTTYSFLKANQRLVEYIQPPVGSALKFSYRTDSHDYPLIDSIEDGYGRRLSYKYERYTNEETADSALRVSSITFITDKDLATVNYGYDNEMRLTSVTLNKTDQTTVLNEYTYADPVYLTTEVTDDSNTIVNQTTLLHSSSLAQITHAKDARGKTTRYTYTELDIPTSNTVSALFADGKSPFVTNITDRRGSATKLDYNFIKKQYSAALDVVASEVTISGTSDGKFWDLVQRLNGYGSVLESEDAAGTEYTEWNTQHLLPASITDRNGNRTSYRYDDSGNQTEKRYTYNGRTISESQTYAKLTTRYSNSSPVYLTALKSKTDGEGRTLTYTYGNKSCPFPTLQSYPYNKYQYDNVCRLSSEQDNNGNVFSYRYDNYGYKKSVNGPANSGFSEEYTLNDFGELIRYKDPEDFITSYTRNIYGQPLTVTESLGKISTYEYDNAGNKVYERDPIGRESTFTYDAAGNLTTETRLRGCDGQDKDTSRLFTYTERNSIKTETDWNGNKTSYDYDEAERINAVHSPANKRVTYTLDGNGNRTREIFTTRDTYTGTVNRTFNELNQILTETDAEDYVTTNTYDNAGNLLTQTAGNGLLATYTYDAYNRKSRQVLSGASSRTTEYSYDMNGRLLTEKDDLKTITHTWNSLGYETQTLIKSNHSSSESATTVRAYDALGHLLTETDPAGDKTTYIYDALYRLTEKVNAEGERTYFGYDLAGQMLSKQLANGNTINYRYDASGHVIEQTDNLGLLNRSRFDCQGNLTVETDGNGYTTRHSYNELNQKISTQLPLNGSGIGAENFTYDHQGNLLTHTNAMGVTRRIAYDKRGFVTSATDFNGHITRYVLDGLGKPTSVTDAAGKITNNTYDVFGDLLSTTDPLGYTTKYTYDTAGNQISVTDAKGSVTVIEYNAVLNQPTRATTNDVPRWRKRYYPDGQLYGEYDALGNSVLYEYDGLKRPTLISGKNLAITQYQYTTNPPTRTTITPDYAQVLDTYDERGQLISSNASGAETTYSYDLAGNKTAMELPEGQTTYYGYDALNRMTSVTEAGGAQTFFAYDDAGRKTAHTDAAGRTTTFSYDNNGNLTTINYTGALTTSYSYDERNLLMTETRPDYGAISRGYDAIGQQISQSDNSGDISWSYDANGNVTGITYTYDNGLLSSGSESYVYDAFNRRTSFTDIGGLTTQWRYDNNDQVEAITYPNGNSTNFTWDERQRLASIITAKGSATYSYYNDDQIESIEYSNGAASHYEYTDRNQVSSIRHTLNSATLAELSYTYDGNDNRLTETKNTGTDDLETSYRYDADNQLSSVDYPAQYDDEAYSVAYTYDSTHNRLTETVSPAESDSYTRTYTYNELDQLTQIISTDSDQTQVDYAYDGNGNLSQKITTLTTDDGINSTTLNYTFDARGELQQITSGGSSIGQFLYDSNGQRLRALFNDDSGTQISYRHSLYQGLNLISQYDVSGTDSYSLNANYQFNPEQKQIIGREAFNESDDDNNTQTWYHTDSLGSVLATSKRTQTIAARYDYDAWGNEINNTDTSDNPIGYTGHQMDRLSEGKTGLIYANARYLDPDTGRFLSFDPFEGYDDKPVSLNKYLYAYQNPLVYTDPTGRVPVLDESGEYLTKTAESLIDQAGNTDSTLGAIALGVGAGANYVVGGVIETVNFGLNIVAADGWLGSGVKERASSELDEAFATIQTIVENPKGTAVAVADSAINVAEGVASGEHKAYAQAAAAFTSLVSGKPNTSVSTAARSAAQTTAAIARASAQVAKRTATGVKEFSQALVENAMVPRSGQLFGQRGAVGDLGASVTKSAGNKIPNCELCGPPNKRGTAPIGNDGHPVELHHRNQNPNGPIDEMTRTDHRLGDNFKKNHSNTGQEASQIDRAAWRKEQKEYWKNEWDSGRFDDM